MNLKTITLGKIISKTQRMLFEWTMTAGGLRKPVIEDFYFGRDVNTFNETDWKLAKYPYVFAVPMPVTDKFVFMCKEVDELFTWLMENTSGMFEWTTRINKENSAKNVIIDIVVAFDDEDDVMLFKLAWLIGDTKDNSKEMER